VNSEQVEEYKLFLETLKSHKLIGAYQLGLNEEGGLDNVAIRSIGCSDFINLRLKESIVDEQQFEIELQKALEEEAHTGKGAKAAEESKDEVEKTIRTNSKSGERRGSMSRPQYLNE